MVNLKVHFQQISESEEKFESNFHQFLPHIQSEEEYAKKLVHENFSTGDSPESQVAGSFS